MDDHKEDHEEYGQLSELLQQTIVLKIEAESKVFELDIQVCALETQVRIIKYQGKYQGRNIKNLQQECEALEALRQAKARKYEAEKSVIELQEEIDQITQRMIKQARIKAEEQAREKAQREAELEPGKRSYQRYLESQRKEEEAKRLRAEEAKRLRMEEEKNRSCYPFCYPHGCSTCTRAARGLECLMDTMK